VRSFDVAIIGGGIIGTSIAFELAAEKLRVIVLERQQVGREASWAAAGMLSPSPHRTQDIPLVPFAKESLRIYPEFCAAVESESGKSIGYDRPGVLEIFTDACGETERDGMIVEHRALDLTVEPISIDDARKREPELCASVTAAAWLPGEATVDPRLLMDALVTAARARGAEILPDCGVSSLLCDGARCTGVLTSADKIFANHVVVAAGCFSGDIALQDSSQSGKTLDSSQYAPTKPVRGQILALRPKGRAIRHVLRSREGYLVPRRDGRIVAGSTLEDAGFEKCVTPGGLSRIVGGVRKLWSALDDAELLETWCGLRPGTPDDLPILGPTDIEGLMIATGHYRNGILLAPASARLIREWIIRGKVNFEAGRFSPLRFLGHPLKPQNAM
jgi:glycine oxidase